MNSSRKTSRPAIRAAPLGACDGAHAWALPPGLRIAAPRTGATKRPRMALGKDWDEGGSNSQGLRLKLPANQDVPCPSPGSCSAGHPARHTGQGVSLCLVSPRARDAA